MFSKYAIVLYAMQRKILVEMLEKTNGPFAGFKGANFIRSRNK